MNDEKVLEIMYRGLEKMGLHIGSITEPDYLGGNAWVSSAEGCSVALRFDEALGDKGENPWEVSVIYRTFV